MRRLRTGAASLREVLQVLWTDATGYVRVRLAVALGIRLSGAQAPKFIHVAGTNGKGSVCAMIDACCRAAGLRSGLFTSPHLTQTT